MVYESDFYTSRRPYSTYSRPTVTSYSVTRREVPWHLVPTVPRPSLVPPCYTAYGSRGLPDDEDDDYFDYPYSPRPVQPYHKNIPYIGHKRLVIVQPSATGWRVKQSSLIGEVDRIYHKVRPSLAYQPKEDYLNTRSIMDFDDETRSIRAKTAEILKRIHTPVPRAQRPLPLPGEDPDEFLKLKRQISDVTMKLMYPSATENLIISPRDRLYYSHTELPITERITSDHYIDRLISSAKPLPPVYMTLAEHANSEPRTYSRLGQGRLACLTYAGGRPISRRKNLASVENYIRDDINVLSHYSRFRQAAEKAAHQPDTEYGSIPHLPPSKSSVTGSWKSNAPRRTQSDKSYIRTSDLTSDDASAKRKKREENEEDAMKDAEEEKRRNEELKRQEELAEQAAAERQAELERKAQQEEEERKAKEEEEARLAKEEEERRKAQEEAERKAEEERKAREEEERRAREEEERKAKEEEERRIREEEERKAREEEERIAREEEERRQREEEERLAREEEERRLKEEEEERKAEEERIAREEEEKRKAEEEAAAAEEEEPAEEEEKPEEEEPKAEVEEVNEPEAEEPEDEPVVEEPQSPVEAPAKSPAEEEDEEEEEEDE